MKILQVSTYDTYGGASRSAYWLNEELNKRKKFSSKMFVQIRYTEKTVQTVNSTLLPRQFYRYLFHTLDRLPLKLYRKNPDDTWSNNLFSNFVHRSINKLAPNLINIHWVGLGFLPIQSIPKFNAPILWTVRDMWPFTGGCHYTNGCTRYQHGCGKCPQIGSSKKQDLSRSVWSSKYHHWQDIDIQFIAISSWLKSCMLLSPLMKKFKIDIIPNGVDTDKFRPQKEKEQQKLIILYGANAPMSRRKGYFHFMEALELLSKTKWKEKIEIWWFGLKKKAVFPSHFPRVRNLGYIGDDDLLSKIYSTADVMVVPSIQEAQGKTVLEAMASGTPVVAFADTGPADAIDHQVDGYLANDFSPLSLMEGIIWSLEDQDRLREMSDLAREKIMINFDLKNIAYLYETKYQEMIH
ncbi:MAG: glycosyltransferase [Candidatus Heimdallarchaeota archaeon]|nr:glycosyltransferase [Candidatus Heimdallarchaeota archaeon]